MFQKPALYQGMTLVVPKKRPKTSGFTGCEKTQFAGGFVSGHDFSRTENRRK
jgi:hypothetical protein